MDEQMNQIQKQRAELVEKTYERFNFQKTITQLKVKSDEHEQRATLAEAKKRESEEKYKQLEIRQNVETEENSNFRKTIDALNKKIEILKSKLE